jgi:hypothetical protein
MRLVRRTGTNNAMQILDEITQSCDVAVVVRNGRAARQIIRVTKRDGVLAYVDESLTEGESFGVNRVH